MLFVADAIYKLCVRRLVSFQDVYTVHYIQCFKLIPVHESSRARFTKILATFL